jgi:hypothetical protein
MRQLQRPATLKEFVIHSLLAWRERDTLVDTDDEEPTALLRRPDSDAPPPDPPRSSFVFDLSVVPHGASRPSLAEATPAAAYAMAPWDVPVVPLRAQAQIVVLRPAGHARAVARAVLLALVVLAGLSIAGETHDARVAAGAQSMP